MSSSGGEFFGVEGSLEEDGFTWVPELQAWLGPEEWSPGLREALVDAQTAPMPNRATRRRNRRRR